jgi:hypothetical protein
MHPGKSTAEVLKSEFAYHKIPDYSDNSLLELIELHEDWVVPGPGAERIRLERLKRLYAELESRTKLHP